MNIGILHPDLTRAVSPFRVRLDWRAYWHRFKESHGGDPVPFKGRLLFQDGWTYSSTDHAGPEWPPLSDAKELLKLQLAYWSIRLKVVKDERDWLRALVASWEEAQAMRSTPLQQQVVLVDPETRERTVLKGQADIESLKSGRLAWLEGDVASCEARVKELRNAIGPQPV